MFFIITMQLLHPEEFGTGYYNYDVKVYPKQEVYQPWRIYGEKPMHAQNLQDGFQDCIPYTVNILMGYPYFRCREQVIRLIQVRSKRSQWKAMLGKKASGVSMKTLQTTFALSKFGDQWVNYYFDKILNVDNLRYDNAW